VPTCTPPIVSFRISMFLTSDEWTNPWSSLHVRGTPPSFRGPHPRTTAYAACVSLNEVRAGVASGQAASTISVWRIRSPMTSMRLKSASVISTEIAVICSRDCKLLIVMTRSPFVGLRLVCDQAIRPAVWCCVKIWTVLQWHHSCSKKSARGGLGASWPPQQSHRWRRARSSRQS
jgi:hypothetical protein